MKRERRAPAGGIVLEAKRNDWQTPEHVLERVRMLAPSGRIALDPATAKDNPTRALRFCSREQPDWRWNKGTWVGGNGLAVNWHDQAHGGLVFLNAPYGEGEGGSDWIAKTAEEARRGAFIASLRYVNKTEQEYMIEAMGEANMACYVRGRVAHRNPDTGDDVSGGTYASWILGFNVPNGRRWRRALEPLCGTRSMQDRGTERSLCWEVRPL